MSKYNHSIIKLDNGHVDIEYWLQQTKVTARSKEDQQLLQSACALAQLTPINAHTDFAQPCLQQGLEMAELLLDLKVDAEAIATAIVYPSYKYADLDADNIKDELGDTITSLASTVAAMDAISQLGRKSRTGIDTLRKMLLAMVKDIRGVLIKLVERIIVMRHIKSMDRAIQHELAEETMDIYAPLANRLGIFQLKWELEDLGFRYLEPDTYKSIAKSLAQRRQERIDYVSTVINQLETLLAEAGIKNAEVAGRAKHIYSIYRKMQRKKVDYEQVYDAIAVRILVPSVEDCYAALGCVHAQWNHIIQEFDDYIANPKPNGYKSLHTAVVGPKEHNIEVQIRTYDMHQESELGVAAHWAYKEGKQQSGYDTKIAWLRQLFAWQQEVKTTDSKIDTARKQVFEDRVYVFTPTNDIIDLPADATPLDFAYHIHSEIGHRCRGAKIDGHIVPLTYQLNTGERVEVITGKQPHPSRDWANTQLGYLKSPRARAKVMHWFKQLDFEADLAEGEKIIAREAKNHSVKPIVFEQAYEPLNFKTYEDMLAALGRGDIKIGSLLHKIPEIQIADDTRDKVNITNPVGKPQSDTTSINIQGVKGLLTTPAACCKPVPGDNIIGYITRGQGITIHQTDCANIDYARKNNAERLIDIDWSGSKKQYYPVDIYIEAENRTNLVRDISAVLSNTKINIISFNTIVDKKNDKASIWFTVEITDYQLLNALLTQIKKLPNIINVKRQ